MIVTSLLLDPLSIDASSLSLAVFSAICLANKVSEMIYLNVKRSMMILRQLKLHIFSIRINPDKSVSRRPRVGKRSGGFQRSFVL